MASADRGRLTAERLLAALAAIVGPGHVLVDEAVTAGYGTDWTRRFHGRPLAVARPGDTAQVAACLAACAAARVAVVCQGGNTGLVGGGVPRGGEVVLSFRRLDDVAPIDTTAGQVEAGAGATLASVQAAARAAGLDVGVDLGARDAATIGGMVATNAGGSRVFREGTMRRQVVGLEAALPDGGVLSRLGGLVKDNVGYDLAGLLCGSEGTLAAVTRVRLRLIPHARERAVALVACADVADALAVARPVADALPSLCAAEFLDVAGMALVRAHAALPGPFPTPPVTLLVECAARRPVADDLVEALAAHAGRRPVVLAADAAARAALWSYRERLTEALNAETVPIKCDVAVPLPRLPDLLAEVGSRVRAVLPRARTVCFGHLLDGNVHVNVNDPATDPAVDPAIAERVERAVLLLVASLGGSVSAEHGIGVAKAAYLSLGRSPADVAAMRAVKRALDPAGVMNPGVILRE